MKQKLGEVLLSFMGKVPYICYGFVIAQNSYAAAMPLIRHEKLTDAFAYHIGLVLWVAQTTFYYHLFQKERKENFSLVRQITELYKQVSSSSAVASILILLIKRVDPKLLQENGITIEEEKSIEKEMK